MTDEKPSAARDALAEVEEYRNRWDLGGDYYCAHCEMRRGDGHYAHCPIATLRSLVECAEKVVMDPQIAGIHGLVARLDGGSVIVGGDSYDALARALRGEETT